MANGNNRNQNKREGQDRHNEPGGAGESNKEKGAMEHDRRNQIIIISKGIDRLKQPTTQCMHT
jgi:hypothetical protein